jgi:hypothetical protein
VLLLDSDTADGALFLHADPFVLALDSFSLHVPDSAKPDSHFFSELDGHTGSDQPDSFIEPAPRLCLRTSLAIWDSAPFFPVNNLGWSLFATVDHLRHSLTGQEIALKSTRVVTVFLHELAILAQLKHSCVVEFCGFSRGPRGEYRLATIHDDTTLAAALENDRLTSTAKSAIVAGIALGMRYLHSQSIAHRDLKPSNVLLERADPRPRICNFNLSQVVNSQRISGSAYSSPHYMAPEAYGSVEGHLVLKADVFSFALML